MQLAIVIMAAGKGTRLKSRRPKVLHHVGGKPLVEHVISAAAQAVEPKDIYVVIGHEAEAVRAAVAHTGVRFVEQAEQRGTGHAILTARPEVEGYETLIVLSGDAPMITTETILRLRDFHLEQQAAMTILTARPPNPTGYGRVIRKATDKPEVLAILEQKALKPEQLSSPEINSGIYAFRAEPLFKHIGQLSTDNAHGEYYLTDMAALLGKASERVVALETADVHEVLGANTIAEMMELDAEMRMRAARALMAEGVTIFRPETSVIDGTVKVGADTIVEPFVQLLGRTVIGSGCRIRSYSVIEDSTIGDDVLVRNGSIITSAVIANNALIGPYSHLRPESEIGEGAHVGNFVETKKARLGAGAKANHLSYLGDADVGPGTNIGAGAITCNYDGKIKSLTKIGANVFVGSDATLVAPLAIADGSYIAAGSTITEDVPADALALGRARQTTKPDWAKKMRSRQDRE
jgi:bifunctional UDP-N-acetylglucosamine pyrophosphorylase / glucosamine-1-phosphate N-acetyltransferase